MQVLQELAAKNGPLCVGLDTDPSYIPENIIKQYGSAPEAVLAYNKAMPNAKPALLEPIGKVTVIAPEEYTGTLMGDITKRRGLIMDMAVNDEGDQVIRRVGVVCQLLKRLV